MARPNITFVLPTHNRCAHALKTLSLLRASVGRLPHEILVIDSACTDGTARAVEERFPEVRLIELSTHHDAMARNLAVAAAQADYVFMLDDATWCDKGTPEFALRMLSEQPRLAAAVCRVRVLGEPRRREPRAPAGVFAGSGVVLRRQAIMEVGGYPIEASDFAEQYDLCARLWQGGWRVERFESMLAWREQDTERPDANAVLKSLTANALRFWARFAPDSQCQAMLDETIEGYRRVAEKESAMAGFEEGMALGLEAARQNQARRRPLSEEQLASLFGPGHKPLQLPQASTGVPTAA